MRSRILRGMLVYVISRTTQTNMSVQGPAWLGVSVLHGDPGYVGFDYARKHTKHYDTRGAESKPKSAEQRWIVPIDH